MVYWVAANIQLWWHQRANYPIDLVCTHIHEIAAKVSTITIFLRSDGAATMLFAALFGAATI